MAPCLLRTNQVCSTGMVIHTQKMTTVPLMHAPRVKNRRIKVSPIASTYRWQNVFLIKISSCTGIWYIALT